MRQDAAMYRALFRFLVFSLYCTGLTACSLVTVPVKTVGSVANTTVKTAGGVAEAPFKAAATRKSGRDSGYGYGGGTVKDSN